MGEKSNVCGVEFDLVTIGYHPDEVCHQYTCIDPIYASGPTMVPQRHLPVLAGRVDDIGKISTGIGWGGVLWIVKAITVFFDLQ